MRFLKAPREPLKGACRGHSLLELFRARRNRSLQVEMKCQRGETSSPTSALCWDRLRGRRRGQSCTGSTVPEEEVVRPGLCIRCFFHPSRPARVDGMVETQTVLPVPEPGLFPGSHITADRENSKSVREVCAILMPSWKAGTSLLVPCWAQ